MNMDDKSTKIWYVTDLCGSDACFKKVINVVTRHKRVKKRPDLVIIAGDLSGTDTAIVIETSSGGYQTEFRGEWLKLHGEEDLKSYESLIQEIGGYVIRMSQADYSSPDRAHVISRRLDALRCERLEQWVTYAKSRIGPVRAQAARVCITPGANDPVSFNQGILDSGVFELCDDSITSLDKRLHLLSVSHASWPFKRAQFQKPPRMDESDVAHADRISGLAARVPDMKTCVFNIHQPPYGTRLDMSPLRDQNGVPEYDGLECRMEHVGSEAVRTAVETHEPCVSLHGAVHEPHAFEKIGSTWAYNPGSEAALGLVCGVWLEFEAGRIKRHGLTREENENTTQIEELAEEIFDAVPGFTIVRKVAALFTGWKAKRKTRPRNKTKKGS